MTEDEAKTKVCPVGKMRGSFDGNWDKGGCIGSACMAWRSQLTAHEILPAGETPERVGLLKVGEPIKSPKGSVQEWARYDGYCGLAGRP